MSDGPAAIIGDVIKDELGVVVLTYGKGPSSFSLPADLRDAGIPEGRVINPHNPDGRPGAVRQPPGWRRLESASNVGYAPAVNRAIQMHLDEGRRYVMVLTHDVHLPAGSLARLVEAAQAGPRYGVLGPALVRRGEGDAYSQGGVARKNGTFGHRPLQVDAAPRPDVISADWIDGCAMLLRAEALIDVGLFDERFFLYFEDTEICGRMRRGGWSCGVVTDATVETAPGGVRRAVAYQYFFSRNGVECALVSGGKLTAARALLGRLRLAAVFAARAVSGNARTAAALNRNGPRTFARAGRDMDGLR